MEVYHKILPKNFDYTLQDGLYSEMPNNIKAVLSDKNTSKRMLSLIGWKLFLENVPYPELLSKVAFEDRGKPFIPNSEIYFNLSNTNGIVVLAISDQPIGIDIEKLRQPKPLIYKRVFCNEEVDFISSAEDFTYLWTRKEAVVKLFGGGISMGLKEFSVLEDEIEAFGKKVKIEPVEMKGFICHTARFI